MHPGDVAELVESEFERLSEEIADAPELRVKDLVLKPGPSIAIKFSKTDRPRLQMMVPTSLLGPAENPFGKVFEGIDLGSVSERELVLLVGCDDHDGQPPTAELTYPDGTTLPAEEWPTALGGGGVINGHPHYNRPFFCRRGLREFHTHPQHEDDPWDSHRESLPLHRIILSLLSDLQGKWIAGG